METHVDESFKGRMSLSQLLIITALSLSIAILAILNYFFQKFAQGISINDEVVSLDTIFLSMIGEILSISILIVAFNKEHKFNQLSQITERLKRYIMTFALCLVICAIFMFVYDFLKSGVSYLISVINETFLLLSGVIIILRLYLSPDTPFKLGRTTIINVLNTNQAVDSTYINQSFPGSQSPTNEPSNTYSSNSESEKDLEDKLIIRFKRTFSRLNDQKEVVHKQANVNLTIGISIAITGLIVLVVLVQFNNGENVEDLISKFNYFSRLSLVVFVELLAIFFLRLYKENLREKRYYQNELTNVELKLSSILIALESPENTDRSNVISAMILTERNFILKKDESTVDLKKTEIDNDFQKKVLDKLDLLSKTS